ncbi:MAG: hypothetical protein OER95_15100, partial [Acidimicrobiia bacterium]|nr:hypothetical protein [Acidimicrobiia bacterium]
RLAERFPDMTAHRTEVAPGLHLVGGSADGPGTSSLVERLRRRSAITYGAARTGWGWLPFRTIDALLPHPPRP